MDFFVVDWSSCDLESGSFEISAYGKTETGLSACARIEFLPYFFVEVPAAWSAARHAAFIAQCVHEHQAVEGYSMLVRRKSIWGFSNGRERTFAQLAFRTDAAFRRARRAIPSRHHFQTYESSVDHIIRFFHARDIPASGWISVAAPLCHVSQEQRATRCDIEILVSFKDVSPAAISGRPPPPLIFASWDLECYSASGKFPVADTPGDVIIGIGTTFQKYGDPQPYKRSYIALGETSDIDGCDVVSCGDEAGVINEWIGVLDAEKVDVLIGYNTFGFDYRYVHGRATVLVDEDTGDQLVDVSKLGRALEGGGEAIEKVLSSNAYGDNKFFFLATPGIFPLDLIQIIRKEHKLSSYSLDAVSQHFLGGERKLDMKAPELFRKFAHGNADDRADIGKYCVRDTELPLKLMTKMSVFPNTLAMANATRVPPIYLLTRGQQIKVFSVVLRKARQLGFLCPDIDYSSRPPDGEYVGATVLDAQRGAYFEPVSALDFASLYPSIMRAHNMCYSTIVLDPAYANLPGVEYYTIDLGNGKTCTFAQNVPSVLPALLEEFAQYRKASKKAMAAAKDRGDAFEATIHNGAQLAYKVTSNSVYGFCGASRGFLPLQDIAASVTATGRAMISETKALAEKLVPGSKVVYGDTDSVMVMFALGTQDMHRHFEVAERVAKDISATFKHPIELEFEKVYCPYLLFSKKRYAGKMFTNPETHDYIDIKGLQIVRRDNCPLVRDVSSRVLDAIMLDMSPERAVTIARESVLRLLCGKESLESLVVSKALRADYKNAAQPHVTVASKIAARRGFPVPYGERVPYVFVDDPAQRDSLQHLRAEDPAHVAENGLDVDVLYYLDHQLFQPLKTLLEVFVPDVDKEILGHVDVRERLDPLRARHSAELKTAKRIRTNVTNRQREITSFFSAKKCAVELNEEDGM